MKIHKNDIVKVLVGKDRGKTGKVLHADAKENTVLIEGINTHKKHARSKKPGEKGQVIVLPSPLNISKVMLICPSCKDASKIGYKIGSNKDASKQTKERVCKSCEAVI